MGFNDTTSYSIPAMEELKADVETRIKEYNQLRDDLNSNIADLHNYWNTNSEGSEEVYTNLLGKYNSYKQVLEEGAAEMQLYRSDIEDQIEKYQGAETATNNTVSG